MVHRITKPMKPQHLTPCAAATLQLLLDGNPHTATQIIDTVSPAKSRKAVQGYISRLRAMGLRVDIDTCYTLRNVQAKHRRAKDGQWLSPKIELERAP